MKKFLVLGGKPIATLDIINYAKSKGLYVIVTDYLSVEQSQGKKIADEYWCYSTSEVEKIVNRARNEGVSGIFTGVHEYNIVQCQSICKKLNLPFYASYDNLYISSKKNLYKNIFKNNKIKIIEDYVIDDNSIDNNIEYPIILKPVDGSGAYGIHICYNRKDFVDNIKKTLLYSKVNKAIAEKYIIEKDEITTVYFIVDGRPYLASVADRIVKTFDKRVIPLPVGYIWPSKYLTLYEKSLDEKMKAAIQEMGLQNGMIFIQSIVKDDNIYPYDIGFRLSGTQEHIILEEICGYNPLKLLVDYAVEGEFKNKNELIKKINPYFNEYACNITFLAAPSKIKKYVGLEKIMDIKGVIRYVKNKLEEEIIPDSALGTLNQVVLRVFAKAKTFDELRCIINDVVNSVKVLNEEGKNIIISGTVI